MAFTSAQDSVNGLYKAHYKARRIHRRILARLGSEAPDVDTGDNLPPEVLALFTVHKLGPAEQEKVRADFDRYAMDRNLHGPVPFPDSKP